MRNLAQTLALWITAFLQPVVQRTLIPPPIALALAAFMTIIRADFGAFRNLQILVRGRSSGVEHNLAKVRVVSSSLIARSIITLTLIDRR